jgi:hypothetical protein
MQLVSTVPEIDIHSLNAFDDEDFETLEAHVKRMLGSRHFARAETQRRLLEYLWEHRNEDFSEYALATEVLGRNGSFSSTVDASVRVQVSRLRRKLQEYYQVNSSEPEILMIPKGTHQLLIMEPTEKNQAIHEVETITLPPRIYRTEMLVAVIAASAFALLSICLMIALALRGREQAKTMQPTTFWAKFLRGDAPITIILPTPMFFRFANNKDLRIRSLQVNDFQSMQSDRDFTALTKEFGQPILEQPYTVTWDTLAAIDMARYLDRVGDGDRQRISFDVMKDSSMTVLESHDVIAVGTHQTLQPLHEYLGAMNFTLARDEGDVINAHPAGDEQAHYGTIQESPDHLIRPSIISILPGRAPGLKVLLLQSRDPAALVSFLSSSAGDNSISDILKKHGEPDFYEMVVETETENDRALRTWPIAVHSLSSTAPASTM